jgi:Zn-dependent protease with chaperone function/tetratricopeptide (TPR) repeat protein
LILPIPVSRLPSAILILLAFALGLLPRLVLASDDWTPADTLEVQASDRLFSQNDFVRAEATSRAVLDRHPNSVTALLYHIKDLEALNKTAQALTEARHAMELSPADPVADEWLGVALVRTGQGEDAQLYLNMSLVLNPKEESTSLWLARAYEQNKQQDEANKVIDDLLARKTDAQKAVTEQQFADTYYQTGDKPSALYWWRRAAQLGSTDAAQWLSWAYTNGYGVTMDTGDSAYWSRRTANPDYAWFPRLPFADQIDAWANGWGLVLIAVAVAIILPAFTINLIAFACSGGLTTDPFIHWSERARLSYPFQVLLAGAAFLVPLIQFVGAQSFPRELLPLPKAVFALGIFVIALLTCNAIVAHWTRRYRDDAGTSLQNLKDLGVMLYIYLSTLALIGFISSFMPSQWGLEAALYVLLLVSVYLFMNVGIWLLLGRLLGVFRPADAGLRTLVTNLAQRIGQRVPTPYLVNWRKANAYAVPLSNAVCITRKAREILTPAETEAVLAHEMAHISEPLRVRITRALLPLFMFLPMFTMAYWNSDSSPYGLLPAFGAVVVGAIIYRRLARRMEVRADALAQNTQTDPGIYPAALAKLYEANLTPAVMPGRRKVHPHLYDRLLAAGVTPDFPRPQPPKRWGIWAALAVAVVNYVCLVALWLALF